MHRFALACALLSACGLPMMLDLDGRPIQRPALVASGDGVWLVVDTSRQPASAVAELQLGSHASHVSTPLPVVRLELGEGVSLEPRRVRPEPPVCRNVRVGGGTAARLAADSSDCYRVLRAEFALEKAPAAADSARLIVGREPRTLRWESPPSTDLAGASVYRPPTPLGLDAFFPVPDDNPPTSAKIEIGRRLFFDRRLSADRSIACASCHRPGLAFSDSLARSRGAFGREGMRNAPALINLAYAKSFFWDGRALALEDQVLRPIQDSSEMALPLDQLERRLTGDRAYRRAFRRAFGHGGGITSAHIARSLASYVRTLRFGGAPIDRYRAGETAALSPEARRGLGLFLGRANCTACHLGPTFSDDQFHNTGVSWEAGTGDLGRYTVTGLDADRGKFSTPTLRQLVCTAPYMHDGSVKTLDEVVEFYDGGGKGNPYLDPEIRPLRLTQNEKRALVAFLRALTGDRCGEWRPVKVP